MFADVVCCICEKVEEKEREVLGKTRKLRRTVVKMKNTKNEFTRS